MGDKEDCRYQHFSRERLVGFGSFSTICTPRKIIPKNFNSFDGALSEELGNKQTHSHRHIFYFFRGLIYKDVIFIFLNSSLHLIFYSLKIFSVKSKI